MKKNNKGFTLAELLIVVAIIGVLIAIAMPTFTKQLERSREAADIANLRAAYGEATAAYLSGTDSPPRVTLDKDKNTVTVTGLNFSQSGELEIFKAEGTSKLPFDGITADAATAPNSSKKTATFTFVEDGTVSCTLS